MDALDVVAHGPSSGRVPGHRPYVPDKIVLSEGGAPAWLVGRNELQRVRLSESDYGAMVERGLVSECSPERLRPSSWPCVEPDGGLTWFLLSDERRWRGERAMALLAEAKGRKDPLSALEVFKASAAMAAVDLPQLLEELESVRRPGENLADAYARVKK